MGPYVHFTIDIETANAEPTEAERWCRLNWSPSKTWKPATIGERYLEMLAKKEERLALLDQSPIICVSIRTEQDLRCLHCMRAQEPTPLANGLVEGFADERGMLVALRNLLEHPFSDEGTVLIGHNIRNFDLPKLRTAYVRNRLKLPFALVNHEQPTHDNMLEFGHGFSLDHDPFISASDLAESFGIGHHKRMIAGEEIPGRYERGEYDVIITYAMADVLLEYDVFLRMTGLAQDEAMPAPPVPEAAPAADDPFPTTAQEMNGQAQAQASTAMAESLRRSNEHFFRETIAEACSEQALDEIRATADRSKDVLGPSYDRIIGWLTERQAALAPAEPPATVPLRPSKRAPKF